MKKITLILISLLFVFIANAQISFKSGDTYKTYTGISGDTLNSSYLLTKSIFLGQLDYKYDYYIEAELDSLGDGTDITCRLRGSMDGSTWTNIGNAITWGVTTSDTSIVYSSLTKTNSITSTIAAYAFTADTTGLKYYFADTVNVGAQTISTTETYSDGYSWRYLQLYFLGGGSGADMSIATTGQPIRIRIVKH